MVSEAAERRDGRQATTLRQLHLQSASLSRADGSASWRQEGTEVLAAVFGPTEAPGRREDPERLVVEVLFRPRAGLVGRSDRESEYVIRRTLETVLLKAMHPRTVVQVVLQIVSDDGSLLSAALNAACFALVDAGVPMSGLFSSVTCALLPESVLVVDPTKEEEEAATATVCLALENHPQGAASAQSAEPSRIITSHTRGTISKEAYSDVVMFCRKGRDLIEDFARSSLKKQHGGADAQ
mmetsp:Transcript_43622/g.111513  ORF Transcript_43622/g.111513 Transcript_43622/m.111513 type:complete len:239 (-) Transcript_43622:333-1049(-)|eukprot:jgi/Tetstr1/421644/TSEL_012584.t1